MGIQGQVALPPLIRKFAELASGRTLTIISQNLAEEAIDLVKQGFAAEKDPFGNPWAPLKSRQGKILQDTARLKNSFTRGAANAAGFRFGSNVAYGTFHQTGTSRMPKRAMVPDGSDLPDAWTNAFQETVEEILGDLFKV
jgi:phage gpG-like protein